ncbi:MAG: condensation domain-containing protein, partial [Reinekea sp.]|nr:condensation domain-containing protein [Reinekea sp.]
DLLAVADAAYEAPATATEAELAKLWSELLGIDAERIGRQAHFFELGGHSLLVVRMIAGIKKAFSKEVSVTDVFSTPLLGTLADAIDRKTNTELAGDHYPITPRSNPDSTQPLTETQKRIWLQCQLNPNDTSFNIFGCYSLQGELDKDRLERALQVVVREHEVLRTRIVSGPQPQQYFDPTLSVSIHHGSIIGLDDDAGRKAIERWKKAEADVHFDLANGPLLRLGCVELTQTSFLLTVNVHHLIADAWTLKLLVDALLKCYEGRSTNEATLVSPIQFGDYATWLTHRANEDNHQSLKSYWRSQLSAPIEPLQIPGCQLSKVTEVTGREVVHTFSPDVTQQLKALATRFDASPYMVLLSVLNVLLFRLSSQSDQIIGMPVSGRDHPQTHDLMGCFVNVLPVRVENIASDTFDDLLKKVRKVCLSAFDHQTLPFEHIVEVANFKRAVGRSPLFDVLLNWFEQVEAQIVIDGLTLQEDSAPVAVAKYPLTIYAHESEGCWRMRWHYQPERLNDKVIEILLNQFSVLVEQLVSRSNQKISELSLVIEGGEMPRWTPADESSVATPYLPEVFNRGLTRFNDNIAVRQGNHQYNYAQLLENADSIVELLKQQAVTPGQVVAVSGYRSFGLVSAMVAVVKSGGVLLMIDSQSSPTRQRQIIDQATPAALLWISDEPTPSVAEYIPKTITINPTACCTASEPGLCEVPNVSADTLAYIFFTSGSTGLPKGVLGNHGGLSHFVHWQKHKYGLGERDKSAQLTGLGFDVLMRDVFTPLISGATVCIPETTLDMSATALFSWMRKEQVTMLHTVPSIMKYWLQDTQADLSLPEEMRIFFAGEPLTTELVERVLQRCGRVNISNFYGPTETTLAKFHFDWYEGGSQMPVVPVGQPISDAGYEVVNEHGQHCGFLEPGEVVIHTVHCSSGYLGSGLTGNFRRITGSYDGLVAYKTGDLGFVSEQGVLQLAGRKDDQVKIRGVRIDLAEVQQAILACHGISNGFVTSFTDDQNDKHIVAYVEFVGGHDDVG